MPRSPSGSSSSSSSSSGFTTKIHMHSDFLIFYMSCPSHSLNLITLITFGEQYKLWISSIQNFIRRLVTSTILGSKFLPRTRKLYII